MYLVNMDEHHKSIAFTWGILFLLKKGMNQLWGIRDQEIKVSKNKTSKNVSSSNVVKKKKSTRHVFVSTWNSSFLD